LAGERLTSVCQNQENVEKGLTAAKEAGLTVFRTWGFNDKNRTRVPDGLPNYGDEGAGPSEVVFQWWNPDGTSDINIEPFDKVVKAATKVGTKLLVALTNNWADYGGMDMYTVNLGGHHHDDVSPFIFPHPLSLLPPPLTTPSPVLHPPAHQNRVQALP